MVERLAYLGFGSIELLSGLWQYSLHYLECGQVIAILVERQLSNFSAI
jgi:hypothetical protein